MLWPPAKSGLVRAKTDNREQRKGPENKAMRRSAPKLPVSNRSCEECNEASA
jgi:hypothetical protein